MPERILETQQAMLDQLQVETGKYFLQEVSPHNGLVRDKSDDGHTASISATGFALSVYPVMVREGLMDREEVAEKTLTTLKFFAKSEQSRKRRATGYRGLYYHYLNLESGERAEESELSTMDTALLMAGVLLAQQYFNQESEIDEEIRTLASELYDRVDWRWALADGPLVRRRLASFCSRNCIAHAGEL